MLGWKLGIAKFYRNDDSSASLAIRNASGQAFYTALELLRREMGRRVIDADAADTSRRSGDDVPKVVITGVCAPYIRKVAEFEYRVSGKIGRYGDGVKGVSKNGRSFEPGLELRGLRVKI
ncbi:hypothetical protein C8J57DRAFT_1251408 [Mycena rebaudengoi]|nr:hypothetical protein C8J57DRAFT_1251408 [Mycena rebaudengoi]